MSGVHHMKSRVLLALRTAALLAGGVLPAAQAAAAGARPKVIFDQDTMGPGGTDRSPP